LYVISLDIYVASKFAYCLFNELNSISKISLFTPNISGSLYFGLAVNEYKTKTKQPDGRVKNEPIWLPEERLVMVKSNKNVDEAFLYDGEEALYDYLSDNKDIIDVRILGDDHRDKRFTGDDLDIDIVFNSRNHSYSTTNTIAKIIKERV